MNEINGTLKIPVHGEEQLKHIHNAEEELLNAGVEFDTGYDLVNGINDWGLDWSLKWAELLDDKTLRFDAGATDDEMKHILFAEGELVRAEVIFKYGFDDFNHRLWMLGELQGAELVIRKTRKNPSSGVERVRPVLKKPTGV